MSLYDAGKKTTYSEQFIEEFERKYGKKPNMVIAEAYEATEILLKALEKTKNLSSYFDNFKEYEGIFGKIVIDKERQAHFPLAVVEIKNGEKKQIVEEFTPPIINGNENK